MTTEKREQHDPFLAAVEAKIAAWTAVATAYRAAASLDGPVGEPGAIVRGVMTAAGASRFHAQGHSKTDLPVGVFRDKSIREAIAIYLGAGRRKQTNKAITLGLQNGGIATTSTNFEATVATALHRMKEDGEVLRFPDGWDLASSYPDNLRNRLEKDAKPKGKARRKVAKNHERVKPRQGAEQKREKPQGPTLDARILEFLDAASPQYHSPKSVGAAIDETDANRLSLAFARLTRYGKVTRNGDGHYGMAG